MSSLPPAHAARHRPLTRGRHSPRSVDMASKHHPLRRSCAFCRARKIKCSNETICEACRRQGADCIYDFEPSRPKARAASQDNSGSDTATSRGVESPFCPKRQRSPTSGSTKSSPVGAIPKHSTPVDGGETVAKILEQIFYQSFLADTKPPCSPWKDRISAYNKPSQDSVREWPSCTPTKSFPENVKYNSVLSLLTHDLVGLVTEEFGCLGCHHIENGGARFFPSSLARDEAQNMFDNTPSRGNPLSEYAQRQQTQLIDVWFSVHPLSFLVSKTLLLRELRDGTHDEILLAVMMADANFSIGDEIAITRGHSLLRWATAQLRTRPPRSSASPQNGRSGVSTRIFSGVSTAQALMLLGWNALCSSQVRRAMCYIGLAASIAIDIKEQMSSTAVPMTSSRINGIDVFDVEKEIISFLYWATYSISLWASIQMGGSQFSALLPTSIPPIPLPVTEASSVIIQLDLVSENFSTIQKQKSVIREMWPVAHIASVISYIYGLYLQDGNTTEAPLLDLQRLQQRKPTQHIKYICREINRVLVESIHALNQQVVEVLSRSLVLVVYHALAIHFLFPMLPQDQPEESLAAETIEKLCFSTHEILEIFESISEQPQDLFAVTPSLRSSFPDVFCLALDTCARALNLVITKRRTGDLLMDVPMAHYDGKIETVSNRLYEMSQHDFLTWGKSLRLTRKHLKTFVKTFNTQTDSSSSGFPSPDNLYNSLPMPQSPPMVPRSELTNLSPATTTITEPTRPFVSAMDMTTLPPLVQSRMASVSDTASSSGTIPFSPVDGMRKLEWNTADDIFHDAPNQTDGDPFSVPGLVGLQNAWFSQMPGVIEVDIGGPMAGVQWDWPELSADSGAASTDSMLYYLDGGLHFGDKGSQ